MAATYQETRPRTLPGRNDLCWCGSGKKYKRCHLRQDQERFRSGPPPRPGRPPLVKSTEQIEAIRRAGRVTRQILHLVGERIAPGVQTGEIDAWVHEATLAAGGTPATLGYKGFPKSCCTSINEVVCHGIPADRELVSGDIVNVDVTTVLDGYFGDASDMFLIGEVDEAARKLVEVTRECLDVGVRTVRPGGFVGDIGAAIQSHAEAHGYSVVRDFGGHGVGLLFHEEPHVPHFGKAGTGHPLLPGMVFTVEPMINAGGWRVKLLADGWTAVTADGSLSAQFEHTVAVTSDGVDVLTA